MLCLFGISCTTDESPLSSTVPPQTGQEFTARLTINMPPASIPHTVTRNQTPQETMINEIRVLVFQNNQYLYSADGRINNSSNTSTDFEATLTATSSPVSLYMVANANNAIDNAGIQLNDSKSAVKSKIQQAFGSNGINSSFPMFGEKDMPSLSENGNQIDGIKMVRSIARADIIVAEDVTNFEMVSAQVFRAKDHIQIIPDNLSNNSVTTPSVPDGTGSINTTEVALTGNVSQSQLYFPESQAPDVSNQTSDATCIIIGGKYNNGSVSYYRIDFNLDLDGHPFGQILRNHKYTFNILKVGSSGEPTPEGAANKPSTGMVAEVETWDENSTDIWYEGENYFSVSKRTVVLRPWAASFLQFDDILVNTNLTNYTIQWSDINGIAVTGTSPSASMIENGNYKVSIIDNTIRVEALTNNALDNNRLNYFVIHAGRWDVVITISQYGLLKHSGDLVRVLSFGGVGDLGNGYDTEGARDANAASMRQILNKQFSPTGLFQFGGYHFTEMGTVGTGTTLSYTTMSNYDVLLFPFSQQPSLTVAKDVLKWLDAKPNRVLIVSADGSNTNTNLLTVIDDNLTWNYTTYITNFNFVVDDLTKIFTDTGLFGSVSSTSYFRYIDNIWGRAVNNDPDVIPLLKTDDGGMVIGVNKKKRIVYISEIQLLQTRYSGVNALTDNNGTVSNDQDKLMANLWAWITEVVLSGK